MLHLPSLGPLQSVFPAETEAGEGFGHTWACSPEFRVAPVSRDSLAPCETYAFHHYSYACGATPYYYHHWVHVLQVVMVVATP